ncbi:class I SAM-dependent methyltransferase [Chloroflexota bacterium]
MVETDAYDEALKSGQYQKPGGLLGKYDNVRRFWEDEQLGLYLRPYLERLVTRKKESGEKLRILDVGCGNGDGFDFITGINEGEALLSRHSAKLRIPEILELYQGIDINEGLLGQARAAFSNRPYMEFIESDLNDFDITAEKPFDLYLANYGTLSHNQDEQTVEFLTKISKHSKEGAIIVIDWLGRYSYEWQTLWTSDLKQNQWMDYAISYIYVEGERERQELTSFPLRIMGRAEIHGIYHQARKKSGGKLLLRKILDRSSFVGRHMDTAQYNPHAQPLRQLVNSLFEPNVSTNLDELLIRYVSKEGFAEVNAYYQKLTDWWNYLVTYTGALLEQKPSPQAMRGMPAVVTRALSSMKRIATS